MRFRIPSGASIRHLLAMRVKTPEVELRILVDETVVLARLALYSALAANQMIEN